MKKATIDYVLIPEQEKELYKRLDVHQNGEVRYIPAKKALKEIRAKLKK